MALYEVVFIARQDLSVEDVDNLSDKFSKIVTDHKGKVVSKEYWGLRTLAYKINKARKSLTLVCVGPVMTRSPRG